MTTKKQIKSGFYWHVHHDKLIEYCYDYDERVDYIKKEKPRNEIETRLRLFKPVKHLERLPKEFVKQGRNMLKHGRNLMKQRRNLLKQGRNLLKHGRNLLKQGRNSSQN